MGSAGKKAYFEEPEPLKMPYPEGMTFLGKEWLFLAMAMLVFGVIVPGVWMIAHWELIVWQLGVMFLSGIISFAFFLMARHLDAQEKAIRWRTAFCKNHAEFYIHWPSIEKASALMTKSIGPGSISTSHQSIAIGVARAMRADKNPDIKIREFDQLALKMYLFYCPLINRVIWSHLDTNTMHEDHDQ